jgi:two-component system alkaline phosphatase synthesis response regulator PhoP
MDPSVRLARTEGEREVTEDNRTAKPRVLCIEDEAGMLDLLQLILEAGGYVFLRAEDGHEGLEAMRREHPEVVLLDLMLPEVDGAEVLLRKKQDPAIRDIPVIAVTALSSPFDQLMWQRHTEIQAYITKPFLRNQILQAIQEVLEKAGGTGRDRGSPGIGENETSQ